jgi:endoglucanase
MSKKIMCSYFVSILLYSSFFYTPTLYSATLKVSTVNEPFPRNLTYREGTIKPDVSNEDMNRSIEARWLDWKKHYLIQVANTNQYYVKADVEINDDEIAETVSEAHGYGMILSVLMAGYDDKAKEYFDGMYKYYIDHPSEITPHLMAWAQDQYGNDIGGTDSATDGDIDIAYALLLADKQWGSSGDIDYLTAARNMIDAIMKGDVNKQQWTLMVGDWAPDDNPVEDKSIGMRSSDFIINELRAFKKVTTGEAQKQKWQNVIDKTYQIAHDIYNNDSPHTGLYPDFIDKKSGVYHPADPNYLEAETDGDYSYNACRTPWRLATDYLLSNETPSYLLPQLQTLNNWIKIRIKSKLYALTIEMRQRFGQKHALLVQSTT